jgi:DNA-binding NtrC family response regulator
MRSSIDGKYVDIVKLVGQSDTKVLVIVVSRTGEWPEYLTAIRAGAFDYLAYPPIPGELQRIIQNAFRERGRQRRLEGTAVL